MSNGNKLSARILVIWEDIDYQNLFSYFLKELGYIVEIVSSCAEGLSVASNNPPDLLILPRWNQDRNDGFEFCRQIRTKPNVPIFPIIIGLADELDLTPKQCIQKTYEVGANACFSRVFDTSDIAVLIKTLLENPKLNKLADRQTMNFAQQE
jgi:CheY-like chemotaxis protein